VFLYGWRFLIAEQGDAMSPNGSSDGATAAGRSRTKEGREEDDPRVRHRRAHRGLDIGDRWAAIEARFDVDRSAAELARLFSANGAAVGEPRPAAAVEAIPS
jgi:hypothetical protein